MAKHFLSLNGFTQLLKEASPGAYTPESIKKTQEIVEDLVKTLGRESRSLAAHAGRKRVTDEEIKMAARFLLKS